MKNNLFYLLLLSVITSATALACVEPNLCKRQDSLIYTSHPFIYIVNFKDKLAKKELRLPLEVKQQIVNDKICILECTKDKIFLTSRGRAYHFDIDKNARLTFVRAFPIPAKYKSKNTLNPDSKVEIEVYKDDKMSISLKSEEKEKHQETDYGKLVIHSAKSILIKSNLPSSEKEELVLSEKYRDEVIPKKFELVLSTN